MQSRCPLCGYEGNDFAVAEPVRQAVCPRCGETFGADPPAPVNVEGRTLAAGSALTAVGVLTLLISLSWIAVNFTVMPPMPPPAPGMDPRAVWGAKFGMLFGQLAPPSPGLLIGVLATLGGIQLIRRRTWGLAVTGAFLAALPCSCGFFFGLPVGVWALLVLANPVVKEAFGRKG